MLSMFLYAVGIMYSPGPINLLGLNQGISGKFKESYGYFAGVGSAMFILFNLYGYTGEKVIRKEYLLYISIIGALYILHLAHKIAKSDVMVDTSKKYDGLSYRDGLMMQLMNPKGHLATLPIATIHFPANGISGLHIALISIILAIMAGGAPTVYGVVGHFFSNSIKKKNVFKVFNLVMAALLVYVAVTIFWDHVYLVVRGVNAY